ECDLRSRRRGRGLRPRPPPAAGRARRGDQGPRRSRCRPCPAQRPPIHRRIHKGDRMTALASPTTSAGSKIAAIGAFRGENLVTNDDIVGLINFFDEWISQRTGIKTRARANGSTSVLDMAVAAAQDALTKAGLSGSDIDVVLVSTVTHFHQTPALAPLVADLI